MSRGKKRALKTVSVPQEEHLQTVVSSADGAKVLKNLEAFAKKLENIANNPVKTFIGSLARELGATKHGSNSQYASFVTDNGVEVAFRIANHEAKVSNFDNHGEGKYSLL